MIMDLQVLKRRREEMMSEAQQDHLAKALRETRKRRGGAGLPSSLAWEIKRIVGRLRKLR